MRISTLIFFAGSVIPAFAVPIVSRDSPNRPFYGCEHYSDESTIEVITEKQCASMGNHGWLQPNGQCKDPSHDAPGDIKSKCWLLEVGAEYVSSI